jgi:hypothetical protein
MKTNQSLYPDDIRELLERMKDDLGEISPEITASLTRHASAIMEENAAEQSRQNAKSAGTDASGKTL